MFKYDYIVQIGSILKKINNFAEPEKNKAITYLKQYIKYDNIPSNKRKNEKETIVQKGLKRKKINAENSIHTLGNTKEHTRRKRCRKIKFINNSKLVVKPFSLKCKICSATRKTKLQFLEHLETHVETPISCLKCKRSFNSKVSFEWHLIHLCHIRKIITRRIYKCEECSQVNQT